MPTVGEAKATIDKIREEYGEHDIDSGVKSRTRKNLEAALKILAEKIYNNDYHFIFELLQNTDDSPYDSNVIPKLTFFLLPDKIIAKSNQLGFMEDNVDAICNIGDTTKESEIILIGEKGIGFKSVFRITNNPEIFSNNYRFRFNNKTYIIPEWIPTIPDYVDNGLTNVVLPLSKPENLKVGKFDELVKTPVLLFLNKLKVIEIKNVRDGTQKKLSIRNNGDRYEIESPDGVNVWKRIEYGFNITEEIENTRKHRPKIIMAFPLNSDGTAKKVDNQYIFAFLPVKRNEFRFIIHADFTLTANRGDFEHDYDASWNALISKNIVNAFFNSIDEFKQDEYLKYTFYSYLPLEQDANRYDVFEGVVQEIRDRLKEYDCILTQSGSWQKPRNVLRIANTNPNNTSVSIKELFTNDDIIQIFKREYISPTILLKNDPQIFDTLGVQRFDFKHLLQCLKNSEFMENKLKNDPDWYLKLFSYLQTSIEENSISKYQIEDLMKVKLIPLEDGSLASTADDHVYFPLRDKINYGFESELRSQLKVINRFLIESEDKVTNNKVKQFLLSIGVREPTAYEIIEDYILPKYSNHDEFSNLVGQPQILEGHIKYIKEHIEYYRKAAAKSDAKDPLAHLKSVIKIKGYSNVTYSINYYHPEDLHLPREYGNKNDLETLFSGDDTIIFVHPDYIRDFGNVKIKTAKSKKRKRKFKRTKQELSKNKNRNEIQSWYNFLVNDLGVSKSLIVKIDIRTKIYKPISDYSGQYRINDRQIFKDNKHETIWKNESWKPTETYYCVVNDWVSIDFNNIIEKFEDSEGEIKKDIGRRLVRLLHDNWDDFSDYKACVYCYRLKYQKWNEDKTKSSFLLKIMNTPFIPTNEGDYVRPTELFKDTKENRSLVPDVPYPDTEITKETFIKDTGINKTVNVEGVVTNLLRLKEKGITNVATYRKFFIFLNDHFQENEDAIFNCFKNHEIILTKNNGKFYNLSDVFWYDHSKKFGNYYGYLERNYPQLDTFFITKLGVKKSLEFIDLQRLLLVISRKNAIEIQDETIIQNLYQAINDELLSGIPGLTDHEGLSSFLSGRIYWTIKRKFLLNDGNLFVNDNDELYKLFKDKPSIGFLKVQDNNHNKVSELIKVAKIPFISGLVSSEMGKNVSAYTDSELTDLVQSAMPYVIRYIYYELPELFTYLHDSRLSKVKKIRCFIVDELVVKYTLKSESAYAERRIQLINDSLYICNDSKSEFDLLAIELSKFFNHKGIISLLPLLFRMLKDQSADNYFKNCQIPELPYDQYQWFESLPTMDDTQNVQSFQENGQAENVIDTKPEGIVINKEPNEPKKETMVGGKQHVENKTKYNSNQGVPIQSSSNTAYRPVIPKTTATLDGGASMVVQQVKHSTPVNQPPSEVSEYRLKVNYRDNVELQYEEFLPTIRPRDALLGISSNNADRSNSEDSDYQDEGQSLKVDKKEIGVVGERYVFEKLKIDFKSRYSKSTFIDLDDGFKISGEADVEVSWLNKNCEQGIGHDILVKENGVENYIEVKSTTENTFDWFKLTPNQWDSAWVKGDNYCIFYIRNLAEQPICIRIRNPIKHWKDGHLQARALEMRIPK